MTQLWKVLAACALTSPVVLAAQEPAAPPSEHEQHATPPAEAAAGGHSMAAMHEHMRVMREQMTRIQATDNAAERQRLMGEHMESMQRHMAMMDAMRSEVSGPGHRAEGQPPELTR